MLVSAVLVFGHLPRKLWLVRSQRHSEWDHASFGLRPFMYGNQLSNSSLRQKSGTLGSYRGWYLVLLYLLCMCVAGFGGLKDA